VDVLLQIADDEDELKQIGVAVVKQQATRMVRRRAISYEVVCEIERCTKEMARQMPPPPGSKSVMKRDTVPSLATESSNKQQS
jgi:hypothetical protein